MSNLKLNLMLHCRKTQNVNIQTALARLRYEITKHESHENTTQKAGRQLADSRRSRP